MSDPSKKVSPAALIALKEALAAIYWYKKDLRSFITYTIKNTAIVATIDWQNSIKYHAASELVDRMAARPDLYHDDLLALFREVANFVDFSHLNRCEDAEQKICNAQEKVEALQTHVKGHLDLLKEKEKVAERREATRQKRASSAVFKKKLEELKSKFETIALSSNHQQRGFDLEPFLNELFVFFDLDPKSSFKIAGEQIDGAFTFDNNDYLLEAKWQQKPVDAGDLYKFAGVLSGKLKNTLGLFISINGFSPECTTTKSEALKAMILMHGADLNAILEGRIDLHQMLYRKRRHASQTGNIYLPIDSAHPEMANSPDIFVARKILSSKYQLYDCGKIFRAPRSRPNFPISG